MSKQMKYILLALMIAMLFAYVFPLGISAAGGAGAPYLPGDLNHDGIVNTTDVVLLRRYIAGGYGVELLPPTGDCANTMALRYDDRVDLSGKTVEIIDAGTPTSYQVGYGLAENTVRDTAVVSLDGNTLIASGTGIAMIKIDGQLYEITVDAAPLSLLLVIGQSNAEGMVGNANQSIACENGTVYSTYAKANGLVGDAGLTVENAGNYVPSALSGIYSTVNVNGTDDKLRDYPVNSLTEAGDGKYGMDSGIAYEWTEQTGEKVWIVNAAHGASSITSWQEGQSNFEEAAALLDACQDVLTKEIAAGHFTFSRMGYYWCQGCADETQTAEWYVRQYVAMHEALKAEMAFDADLNTVTPDVTMEFGGIVLVMAGHENAVGYRKGIYTDPSDSFFATFKELEMRGPRVAQIWLAGNPDLPDIHMVCTLAQDWVTMPDGSDGVAEYFAARYENGKIDYPTQKPQSQSWYFPITPAAVKNSIHYYQIGYNEVGRESARNTLYILGLAKKPETETSVTFVDWTGYRTVDAVKATAAGTSDTLVVPLVSPCYESKTVGYRLTGELAYHYYDLLDMGIDGGILSPDIGGPLVQVNGQPPRFYRFELSENGSMTSVSDEFFHDNPLSQAIASQKVYTLQTPILLKHNKPWRVQFNSVETPRFMALTTAKSSSQGMFYFFKSANGSHVLSMGEYRDGLYQNYGVLQYTINIDWTKPHVYCFQNVINGDGTNTVHIYIDDIWVGTATTLIINGTVHSTDNMYLSGKDFAFTHIGCGGFGLDADQMTYLEVWEDYHAHSHVAVTTSPTCAAQGYTTYTCACGESYKDNYVNATGEHSYQNGACTDCGADAPALKGKKLSVLGASISTYTGISNNASSNATIAGNAVYYTAGRHGVYADDTWWMQAAHDLGLELLVNNSWSGSSLLHERNGTVGAYVERCVQLHSNDGENPDMIAIQMGANDFQYYKETLGTADIDYHTLIVQNENGGYTYATPTTSLEAAAIVLHKISVRYPNAEVYYLNISRRMDGTDELIRSFNAELKQVVEHFGAHIVDIYNSAITTDNFSAYIGDGRVHPNQLGMDAYTEAFKRSLVANTAYQIHTHTVSLQLDGVSADYGDHKIVVDGEKYTVRLTSTDTVNVTVTMGGEDITNEVYANGTITISSVTDDVTISACNTHIFQSYKWEFNGTDLICTEGGNTLVKNAGTTAKGVFFNTKYSLDTAVVLQHDKPWAVEWKCEGTFLNSGSSTGARIFTSTDVNAEYHARYIFKSNINGLIAMGEKDEAGSHNYGIALGDHGIDWTAWHTYRLENRITSDGSNMIYLLVDGAEIGAMNRYYVGTANKNTTSDWLSGKDFVFPYMGTDTHGFTNASIEYILVTEAVTPARLNT